MSYIFTFFLFFFNIPGQMLTKRKMKKFLILFHTSRWMPTKSKSRYTLGSLLIQFAYRIFQTNLYPKNQPYLPSLERVDFLPKEKNSNADLKNHFFALHEKISFPENYRWLSVCKHEITHALETLYSSVDSIT